MPQKVFDRRANACKHVWKRSVFVQPWVGVYFEEIRAALSSLEGVKEVHDLHLWSLTQGSESMSGHLVVENGRDTDAVLKAGQRVLKDKFGLEHVTLQIEK